MWHRHPPRGRALLVIAAAAAVLLVVVGVAVRCGSGSTRTSAAGSWVAGDGTDTGTGSATNPWRTIAHAIGAAPAGARIYLRKGSYPPFTVNRAGLTVSSAPGERATIEGRAGTRDVVLISADNVTLANLTVAGCVPRPKPDVNVHGDHGSGVRVDRTKGVTIRGVTVRDSHGTNAAGLPVGCYGILAIDSRSLLVTSSEVYHNGTGIEISGGGSGVVVERNNVHDQDVILQNTRQNLDDFGGVGLAAISITDRPGPIFRHNTVVRNFGPSTDYGVDGGGVEFYDTANTTVTDNTFVDNDGVMETGTGSRGRCADNVFAGNRVTGRLTANGPKVSVGMVLRCASNLAVRDNTFTDLDDFTFLFESGGPFAGSVDGVRITANTVTQLKGTAVYRLQFGTAATPPMTIDRNRYRTSQTGFAVLNGSSSETMVPFADWRSRTGFDARSTTS
jgi:hypothetical protein